MPELKNIFMDNKNLPITHLIEMCVSYFRENSYTEDRIREYYGHWNNGIIPFMKGRHLETYNLCVGREFRDLLCEGDSYKNPIRDRLRAIDVLDDMLTSGTVRKRRQHPLSIHWRVRLVKK